MEDKHQEEVVEAEHGQSEAPADPTATEAEESGTQSVKGGIEIDWGTMDPGEELEASRKVGGGRDRRRRRRRVAVEEVEEPWENGESGDKNPSVWKIGGLFLEKEEG